MYNSRDRQKKITTIGNLYILTCTMKTRLSVSLQTLKLQRDFCFAKRIKKISYKLNTRIKHN